MAELEQLNLSNSKNANKKSPRNNNNNIEKKPKTQRSTSKSASTTPRTTPRGDDVPQMTCARTLVPLKVEGDDVIKGDIHSYRTIKVLREDRKDLLKKLAALDERVESMLRMKGIYQRFCMAMQNFSTAIFKLDRNNQGVPYVNNVKHLVSKMHEEFNTEEVKSEIEKMKEQQVPFLDDLLGQFGNFQKLCESIIVTHIHYHVTFLEDFHLVAGKIRGMMKTIITLMYDDESTSKDDDDNIIKDQDIQEAAINDEDANEEETKEESNNNKSNNNELVSGNNKNTLVISNGQHLPSVTNTDEQEEKPPQDPSSTPQELHQLRKVFSNINDLLSRIQRLSLGNPRIQSMKDASLSIAEVLIDAGPLVKHWQTQNIPCIDSIENFITKMLKVATIRRPSEKHIEQMKMLLGVWDGRVLIVAKYMAIQN
ncbi:uncharacterized protein [Clytia hemisphaerica]|uniref:uncharacterized protein n=1 Tax=Clytia hemisphaerica TaxID=252671 RepID=UPI0034D73A4D